MQHIDERYGCINRLLGQKRDAITRSIAFKPEEAVSQGKDTISTDIWQQERFL
jgi:hypothetical protein